MLNARKRINYWFFVLWYLTGGLELGLEWAGFGPTLWQVEIDDYATKVLERHWPDTKRFRDIREVGKHNLEPVDLICGGFPCQPFSVAGKRKGKEDDRYLWPEMVRVIKELKPAFVIGENVPGIIPMELDKVLADLEGEGYETTTFIIPACAVNAPHRRDRVWIIAYSEKNGNRCQQIKQGNTWIQSDSGRRGGMGEQSRNFNSHDAPDTDNSGNRTSRSGTDKNRQAENEGWEEQSQYGTCGQGGNAANATLGNDRRHLRGTESRQIQESRNCDEPGNVADTSITGLQGRMREQSLRHLGQFGRSGSDQEWDWKENWIDVATRLCRVDDGISKRVDRLKCLGNAVVPQVAQAIGEILMEWINESNPDN